MLVDFNMSVTPQLWIFFPLWFGLVKMMDGLIRFNVEQGSKTWHHHPLKPTKAFTSNVQTFIIVGRFLIIIIVYFCPFVYNFSWFFLYFVELLQFNRKGRSLDLSVIFLRSGTPTKVTYDVQKTMILLILGTISVCNFFFTNVNKFLVYRNINLKFFFFQIRLLHP